MNTSRTPHHDEEIDFKAIFKQLLDYWPIYLVTIIISVGLAFSYNYLATPVYRATTSIIIDNEESFGVNSLIDGFDMFSSNESIENEIGILQSYSLIKNALLKQNNTINYSYSNVLIQRELYQNCPFEVIFDIKNPQPMGIIFDVTIHNNGTFTIKGKGKKSMLMDFSSLKPTKTIDQYELNGTYAFGQLIKTPYHQFKLIEKEITDSTILSKKTQLDYHFYFNNIDNLTLYIQNNLEVAQDTKKGTIINLAIKGGNAKRIKDFLSILSNLYLQRNLIKKNKIADQTIAFIDHQIIQVTDSLFKAEEDLENYKTDNKIIDEAFQAQEIYNTLQKLETEKATALVQQKYYTYLLESTQKGLDIDQILAPSSMGVSDIALTSLLAELNKLNSEKKSLQVNTKAKNPYLTILDIKITNTIKSIQENIKSMLATSKVNLADIDDRIAAIVSEINQMPESKMKLFTIQRQFLFNDEMYSFLLQKRAEAQLAKASNLPTNELLDKPRILGKKPVSPNKKSTYILALFIALALPTGIVLGKDLFSNTINQEEDIKRITRIPIIGKIVKTKRKGNIVVSNSTRSHISESFRIVRANLRYITKNKENPVILLTSSSSGEGKTFCSINLAGAFALSGRKTLLIGFDMRKPRIYQDFGLANNKGVSSFLINNHSFEEAIQDSGFENLDIMMAGPIPPNPAELIESPNTQKLFALAKQHYEVVIVDTPPIGLVTDSLLLLRYTDANLFVVRERNSLKKNLSTNIKTFENLNKTLHLNILYNDVKVDRDDSNKGYHYFD